MNGDRDDVVVAVATAAATGVVVISVNNNIVPVVVVNGVHGTIPKSGSWLRVVTTLNKNNNNIKKERSSVC